MAKPVIKFKTYRQSQRVGGKIYGVPNLGDPVVASVTMQEVIDYAKLHNYSADTLEALLSQVIAGVGDLVARDGRPRMLSDLLKFEPVIKGTFDNLEQTVTNQKVLVRPRMLKEIKVKLDPSAYSWQNVNDSESPRLVSVAPDTDDFVAFTLEALAAAIARNTSGEDPFGCTYAGSRLCPNGWEQSNAFAMLVRRGNDEYHLEMGELAAGGFAGIFFYNDAPATDNTVAFDAFVSDPQKAPAWHYVDGSAVAVPGFTPQAGDLLVFTFTRTTSTGDTFTVEKKYTL